MREGGSWRTWSILRICVCTVAQPGRRGHLPLALSYHCSQTISRQKNNKLSRFTNRAISSKQQVLSLKAATLSPLPPYTFSSHTSFKQLTTGSMYQFSTCCAESFFCYFSPVSLPPGSSRSRGTASNSWTPLSATS